MCVRSLCEIARGLCGWSGGGERAAASGEPRRESRVQGRVVAPARVQARVPRPHEGRSGRHVRPRLAALTLHQHAPQGRPSSCGCVRQLRRRRRRGGAIGVSGTVFCSSSIVVVVGGGGGATANASDDFRLDVAFRGRLFCRREARHRRRGHGTALSSVAPVACGWHRYRRRRRQACVQWLCRRHAGGQSFGSSEATRRR